MTRTRVGLIGAGRMGKNHCRVLSTLRNTELAGVFDIDIHTARSLAEQYQIIVYNDIEQMLTDVDAVCIVTPTPSHFKLAMRCIEAGIHVLVEKPITDTVRTAELLVEAAEESGIIVQVGHIERFNPAFIELRQVLADNKSILAVNFRRLSPYSGSNIDVDVVLDLMIHDLDLALSLSDWNLSTSTAFGFSVYSGSLDHAVAIFQVEGGPLLTLTASRATEQKVRCLEVTAQKAFLECDLLKKSISVHRQTMGEYIQQNSDGVKYRQESFVEHIHVPAVEPLQLELQSFVDCVARCQQPIVTARDGMHALRLADDIKSTIENNGYGSMELVGVPTRRQDAPTMVTLSAA